MTTTIFIMLLAMFAIISSLLTEGIKKAFDNAGKEYSANIIALINAVVLGCGGTIVAYILLAVPFTTANIVLIPVMIGLTWLGSMLGYDKVMQLVAQVVALRSDKNKDEEEEKIEE